MISRPMVASTSGDTAGTGGVSFAEAKARAAKLAAASTAPVVSTSALPPPPARAMMAATMASE